MGADIHFDNYGSSFADVPRALGKPTQRVALVALDDLLRQDVHYLKIDAEGSECRCFQGAAALFTKHVVDYVAFEVFPTYMRGMGADPVSCIRDFMLEYGYVCFDIWRYADTS